MNFKLDYKKQRKAFLIQLLLFLLISFNFFWQLNKIQEPNLLISIGISLLMVFSISIVLIKFFKNRHKTIIKLTDKLLILDDLNLEIKLDNIKSTELKYSTLNSYLVLNLKKAQPYKRNVVKKIKSFFNLSEKENSVKVKLDELNYPPKEIFQHISSAIKSL